MTKKHFKAIAAIIKSTREKFQNPESQNAITEIELALCDYFQYENERFDEDRFLTACK